ncbi:hypothetical protein [Sinimarinibacterium sp. NLF-5-8]|uniref:hypothetical protein n=1 Tax=Sinimarinibacterium sp. NLF-5-8 TaxID=2698684 RepID=UPI00137C39E6|nr:hypothetical protein [Sinimarinibacterium sp. NLF-5-8]QHS09070.1 hypothetical protein GT972_02180 [Sinimarinibacterium sp. NLF-5-8]
MMNDSEKQDFADFLVMLEEHYNRHISGQMAELYWRALKAYSLAAIQEAFFEHVSDPEKGHFFVQPAHLLAILTKGSQQLAQGAWDEVHRQICREGDRGGVFADPLITQAMKRLPGGYYGLCETRTVDMPSMRAQFMQLYAEEQKQAASGATHEAVPYDARVRTLVKGLFASKQVEHVE